MAFCTNCGAKLEEGKRFCPNCGTMIAPPKAPDPPAFDDGPFQAQPAPGEKETAQARPAPQAEPAPAPAPAPVDISGKVAQLNQTPDTTGAFDPDDVKNHKGMAVLAYFWILVLIPILAAKDSPYARYHSNQGLILLIFSIIASVLGRIWGPLGTIGGILSFILFIIGIVNAANGRAKELPVIGKFRLLK